MRGNLRLWTALIANPVGVGVTSVSNQGTVSGGNFTSEPTDDPATGTDDDATVVTVNAAPVIEVTKSDALQVDAD